MRFPEITVAGVKADDGIGSVLEAIQRSLPIRFVQATKVPPAPEAELVASYSSASTGKVIVRRLHVMRGRQTFAVGPGRISFSDHPMLHASLRGRTIPHESFSTCEPLRPQTADVVLATACGIPVWTARIRHESVDEYTSVPLPEFSGGTAVIDVLNGRNFLQLLPLVHFVRRALADDGWEFPLPRASFMFDDPNLHRESYGFVSYPEIVRRSQAGGYHVAFATIPFDTWYTSPKAADAFRNHPDRISLLIHGNDHTYAELSRIRAPGRDRQLAAQAMVRIGRFEERTGIRVCRSMAAPHGACSNAMMAAMLDVGIESLFCSAWSLRLWDPARTWAELGIQPAEMIDGFAVVPRFRLSNDCEGSAVLCSFLGQPIVPVGHHQDLRDGVDLLHCAAQAINRFPSVTWGNTESLSRSNFISRTQLGDPTMHVIAYSTCISVRIPDGVASVRLHDPRAAAQPPVSSCWLTRHPGTDWIGCNPDQGFSVSPGEQLTFRLAALGQIVPACVPRPRVNVSAPVRRLLCESRDRTAATLWSLKNWIRPRSTAGLGLPKPV